MKTLFSLIVSLLFTSSAWAGIPYLIVPTNAPGTLGQTLFDAGNGYSYWDWSTNAAGSNSTVVSASASIGVTTNGFNFTPFFTVGMSNWIYTLLSQGTNNTTQATNDLWTLVSASTNTLASYSRILNSQGTNNTTQATNDSAAYARTLNSQGTNFTSSSSNLLYLQITNVYVAAGAGGSTNVSGQNITYTIVPGSGSGSGTNTVSAGTDIKVSTNLPNYAVSLDSNLVSIASVTGSNGATTFYGAVATSSAWGISNANGTILNLDTNGNVAPLASFKGNGSGITNINYNTALTNLPAQTLLANPSGSAGSATAITLGANLSFSGNTLVASGGAGSGIATLNGSGTNTALTATSGGNVTLLYSNQNAAVVVTAAGTVLFLDSAGNLLMSHTNLAPAWTIWTNLTVNGDPASSNWMGLKTVITNLSGLTEVGNLTNTAGSRVMFLADTNSGFPPNGTAGGVLSGTYPSPGFGSFTSSTLATALSDETGSGSAVFGISPTISTLLSVNGVLYDTNLTSQFYKFGSGTNTILLSIGTNGGGGFFTNTFHVGNGVTSNSWRMINPSGQDVFVQQTNGAMQFGTNKQVTIDASGNVVASGSISAAGIAIAILTNSFYGTNGLVVPQTQASSSNALVLMNGYSLLVSATPTAVTNVTYPLSGYFWEHQLCISNSTAAAYTNYMLCSGLVPAGSAATNAFAVLGLPAFVCPAGKQVDVLFQCRAGQDTNYSIRYR